MRDTWLGFTIHVHHKGGNSQQEMQQANQVSQQQLQLQQQQLKMQQQQLAMVNPSLQAIIANGGMLPAQQAAMTSAAMQQTGQGFQNAVGAINQNLVARGLTGGNMAGGGGVGQDYGALYQGLLGQQASSLQNIQLAKGQGLMQALGTGLGEAQMYGSQGMTAGGQGVSALGAGVQAAQAADQASTGFWGSLIGGLTGMAGQAFTGAGTKAFGCWVASELYGGWYSDEAMAIRNWLARTWYMLPFTVIYARIAGPWSRAIRRSRLLRVPTKHLFDFFLWLTQPTTDPS